MQTAGTRIGAALLLAFLAGSLSACLEMASSTLADDSVGGPAPPEVDPPPTPSNAAPTITGRPASQVVVGNAYSFRPQAADADGDTLQFTVANKPDWASFNPSTGRLSGTAAQGSEGVYGNIRITASDGEASASLPRFSIEVTQTGNGAVTLSWSAPTENTDGTPLTDLDAYRIYYGQESGNYSNEVDVTNPGTTTHVVDNLVPNTYYFAITASNDAGMESDYSNEAVYTVTP